MSGPLPYAFSKEVELKLTLTDDPGASSQLVKQMLPSPSLIDQLASDTYESARLVTTKYSSSDNAEE
jgi:hypothetical protein